MNLNDDFIIEFTTSNRIRVDSIAVFTGFKPHASIRIGRVWHLISHLAR